MDIDMDFCRDRRGEVIDYIMQRHPGRAAQIATVGYYKPKNLGNDLARVCKSIDDTFMEKEELELFKKNLEDVYGERNRQKPVTLEELKQNNFLRKVNKRYPKILKHFSKLCGQVRFIGKHAAGVAITAKPIDEYCAVMKVKGGFQTCYDLNNLDKIHVIKMDCLGLAAASIVQEAEQLVGCNFKYSMLKDDAVYEQFRVGNTVGIFQFEKIGAINILLKSEPTNIQDLIAATALNRPAPIQLGILDDFIGGKNAGNRNRPPWYDLIKDTYGCVVYQEDVMTLCRELANMEWQDIDKQLKSLKTSGGMSKAEQGELDRLENAFVNGAYKHSQIPKKQARELYNKMVLYLFNKGHGAAYTIIGFYEMYLKIYHPLEFYYSLLKFENEELKREIYKSDAVKNGCILLKPHVNGGRRFRLIEWNGDKVIQEGLSSIKGIGEKTANVIEQLGPFSCYDDFMETVPKRSVNKRSVEILMQAKALEFDQDKIIKETIKYNSRLYNKRLIIR